MLQHIQIQIRLRPPTIVRSAKMMAPRAVSCSTPKPQPPAALIISSQSSSSRLRGAEWLLLAGYAVPAVPARGWTITGSTDALTTLRAPALCSALEAPCCLAMLLCSSVYFPCSCPDTEASRGLLTVNNHHCLLSRSGKILHFSGRGSECGEGVVQVGC